MKQLWKKKKSKVHGSGLFAAQDVKKSNIFVRLFTSLNYLVWGDV